MPTLRISELYIYPVKSCRGIRLNISELDLFGLKNDRRWMVVDAEGVMLTQRKLSRMCLIQPELTPSGLSLVAPLMENLIVDVPGKNTTRNVSVWDDVCEAYDAGDDAARWLSTFLETECRLVYYPEDGFRQVDETFAQQGDKTAFSDGFPLLVVSQASLDDLNQRMSKPVSINRFRPNIVIEGCAPFAEDEWKIIRVGNINLRIVKPCSRCVIPAINIETSEKEDEPTRTLASYRRRDNKIFFGQNVIADSTGEITTDMTVDLIK